MPVFQLKNISKLSKLGIWHITETKKDLIQQATLLKIDLSKTPQTKSESRVKQWLSTRILLTHFFKDTTITYDDLGKPYLTNNWNISISHSGDYVAINLNSEQNCGIDIEKITPKVERIKHKFLSSSDLKAITTIENLTIYWGAKEALYKYYGKREVLFIENLFIENYSTDSSIFNGIINMPDLKKEIKMGWEKIEDYILVYTF